MCCEMLSYTILVVAAATLASAAFQSLGSRPGDISTITRTQPQNFARLVVSALALYGQPTESAPC